MQGEVSDLSKVAEVCDGNKSFQKKSNTYPDKI